MGSFCRGNTVVLLVRVRHPSVVCPTTGFPISVQSCTSHGIFLPWQHCCVAGPGAAPTSRSSNDWPRSRCSRAPVLGSFCRGNIVVLSVRVRHPPVVRPATGSPVLVQSRTSLWAPAPAPECSPTRPGTPVPECCPTHLGNAQLAPDAVAHQSGGTSPCSRVRPHSFKELFAVAAPS